MDTFSGWLLDLYAGREGGVVLWLLSDDGLRRSFRQPFEVSFFAAGQKAQLARLERHLSRRAERTSFERKRRRDLFSGMLDGLSVTCPGPVQQARLFHELKELFPGLDYFDADIPVCLRHGAVHGLFPLSRCRIGADEDGRVVEIVPLESAWDADPEPVPLRRMFVEPDIDPSHGAPSCLQISCLGRDHRLDLKPVGVLLLRFQALLRRYDPDVIITQWGDTWLFPLLLEEAEKAGASFFNPNRDQDRKVLQRRENSFFTYGRVVYRGRQAHLFGRWHIDERNAVMYGGYGLAGVLEQARVTGLAVQEVARKSPGAGITAMQMQTALRDGILVPYQKQQAEAFRNAQEHITADRGGLVYQPLIGLHRDVAEIDFVSMYPSIMVNFNISPETVGEEGEPYRTVPELGIPISQDKDGLVPQTLRPLLARRLAIKRQLAALDERDCRYRILKARSAALKWLLVVCFGYLGYKNARFGRIESHEAVTAFGREALLRAKEAAEDLGYTVLHMYVDGLWVRQDGKREAGDFRPLLDEIEVRTGLPIALDGVYRWVAFLPSREDDTIPVPNRYFGLFRDGKIKMRGIEARRHDTAPFIADAQLEILARMAELGDDEDEQFLKETASLLRGHLCALREGKIPPERLLVCQTLSRAVAEYRVPSPAARAAAQLESTGRHLRPGQRVRFLYTIGEPGVHAWDLPGALEPSSVDVTRYETLLLRAISTVTKPLGVGESELRRLARQEAFQGCLPL